MKVSSILLMMLVVTVLTSSANAMTKKNKTADDGPAQIVIIRHGEKPAQGNELNQQGCERAYSLPPFFLNNPVVNQYGKPVAVFGARPGSADASKRMVQTIAPSAQALGLKVQDPATDKDFQTIVQAVMGNPDYRGKTVLISWEHKAIPDLAAAFGLVVPDEDKKWPGAVFDEAWVLGFAEKKGEVTLQIIPENVLPGDNPEGGGAWQNPPGPLGPVAPDIANTCVDNTALNAIVAAVAEPPLP